jgi:hypothetical protein
MWVRDARVTCAIFSIGIFGVRSAQSKPFASWNVSANWVGAGHALQPHGLPDAGAARVPDGMRLALPVLLAAGLGGV